MLNSFQHLFSLTRQAEPGVRPSKVPNPRQINQYSRSVEERSPVAEALEAPALIFDKLIRQRAT